MQQTSGSRRRGTIQSVDRSARILKALAGGPRRLGVSQLADQLGLSRPTVHGLLQTLQAHGFVEQDRDSDKYQLGAGLLHLGNSYLDHNELRARSIVHAERLAQTSGEAVRVGVLHGPSVVIVHHVFRPDAVFQVLEVGAQLPAHASALGKAMLAWADQSVVARAHGRAAAAAHESHARRRRAAHGARRGAREGARARARRGGARRVQRGRADLRSRRPRVGAIGVAGDTQRVLPRGPARGLAAAVVEAARAISRELGAGRWPARLAAAVEPQPHLVDRRRRRHQLPAARAQRVMAVALAQHDARAAVLRRRCRAAPRSAATSPYSSRSRVDRAPDVGVRHAAARAARRRSRPPRRPRRCRRAAPPRRPTSGCSPSAPTGRSWCRRRRRARRPRRRGSARGSRPSRKVCRIAAALHRASVRRARAYPLGMSRDRVG